VATCAGGAKTLEANIAMTANERANFRGKAILFAHCLICLSTLMRLPGALLRHTYPATVSERLRQGSKTVSLAAEIIHHKATATTDRGFRLILYRAVAATRKSRGQDGCGYCRRRASARNDGLKSRSCQSMGGAR
jgi:hypothetical protein